MPALTSDTIVDRVRSICTGPIFNLVEAVSWVSFDLQPTTNVDGVFRIPPPSSQSTLGEFNYVEDRTDSMQIWVAKKHNNEFDAARRGLLQMMHSLTAAVIRDAHTQSGDYAVPDEGRGHTIQAVPQSDYLTLRLTLPVNYEAQL